MVRNKGQVVAHDLADVVRLDNPQEPSDLLWRLWAV
jgi:hypothetical protein